MKAIIFASLILISSFSAFAGTTANGLAQVDSIDTDAALLVVKGDAAIALYNSMTEVKAKHRPAQGPINESYEKVSSHITCFYLPGETTDGDNGACAIAVDSKGNVTAP